MKRRGILGVFLVSSALAVSAITFSFAKKNVVEYKGVVLPEVGNPEELGYAEPAYSSNLPNSQVYTSSPNDTETNNFTNYIGLLNFGEMRSHYRGDSVKVAVIDSGCNYTHQDFILNGNCVLSEDSASFLYSGNQIVTTKVKNGSSVDFSIIDDDNTAHDGHGTAVCGTIVGQINSLSSMGVAPNVELVVCKTNYQFGEIQTAINYCITHDVDIINMSIQSYVTTVNYNGQTSTGLGSELPNYLQPYIDAAYESGITVIAAGGNYNTSVKSYPANNDHVLAVGALAKGSKTSKAAYSNTGTNVDVVGPGTVKTASASYNNSTIEINGTSFASPVVAGVAALYKQQNPSADPDEIMNAIKNSCTPLGNRNYFGDGAVNVDWLLTPIEDITLNVSSLNLDLNEIKTLSISSITPSNACTNMMYLSDDESIAYADIETGEVKGVGAGNTTIYACSLKDDNYSFEIPVSVTDSTVHVNSISLIDEYSEEQEIKVGDKISLPTKFNVLPSNSTNKNVTYELNVNEGVLSVDSNGLLTALKEGEEIVTITSVDNPEASLDIYYTVGPKDVSHTVNIPYTSFSAGTSGTGSLSTASVSPVTVTLSLGYKASNEERSYSQGTITISGDNLNIKKITINHSGSFTTGQSLTSNPSTYLVSNSSSGGVNKYFVEGSGSSSVTITNSKQLKFTSIDVEYSLSSSEESEKTLESISLSDSHRNFTVGDAFVKETVTAKYSNGDEVDVTNNATFTGMSMNTIGTQTISVSYTDSYGTANKEYTITISAAPVINYTVSFNSNGGTGGSMSNKQTSGSTYVTPNCDFSKDGYTFDKWALNSTSGTKYSVGQTISGISNNIILYATWTKESGSTDDFNGYYNGIDENSSTLLADLRSLNLEMRTSTVGYSSMGTSTSTDPEDSPYMYTDYDPTTIKYNSDGQPYGTKILSFYSGKSTTEWNREHVWPNSRGGGSGGTAGTPYPDADIYMPRPTITEENSDRGNSKYVQGLVSTSEGWDPVAAFESSLGVYPGIRGECARIIFYCMTVNSKLVLDDTATGGTKGVTMGKLSDLLKWNLENPVNPRELTRQSGGQYLQGNRNAFVDHPEYACKIWGDYNDSTRSICSQAPVANKTLVNLTLSGTPSKTSYYAGESFSTSGITITATFDDDSTLNVTNSVVWEPSSLSIGTTSVIGSYTHNNVTKTVTVSGLTVSASPSGNVTLVTDMSQLSNGDLVYIATGLTDSDVGVTGQNGNKDATVSSSKSSWKQYTVVKSGTTYKLQDGTKYIANPTDNEFKYDTTGGSISLDSSSNVKVGSRWFTKNGSNYRCYSSIGSYVPFHLYKINNSQIESVTLNKSSLEFDLYNNSTPVTLQATVTGESSAAKTVSWSSGSSSVATVDSTGKVTPVGVGETTITATSTVDQTKSASCTVTVTDSTPKAVEGVSLNKDTTTITVGSYETLEATITPTNATNKNVTWSSSNSNATVDQNGKVTANVVGTSVITVTTEDGGFTATCTVTVSAAPVITYQLEADQETVPYMSGTNHIASVGVRLYQYNNGVKGNQISYGSSNVDTSSLGMKEISFTYQSVTYQTTVKVTNNGAAEFVGISTQGTEKTETLTASLFDATKTSYVESKGKTVTNGTGAIYSATTAKNDSNIQLKSKDNVSGIVQTGSGGKVTKIKVTFASGSNTLLIYGKNTAYSSAADLYDSTKQGESIGSLSSDGTITFETTKQYDYIGIRSSNGAIYISSIEITCGSSGTTYPATPTNQAEAWSDYFISLTGRRGDFGPCNESTFEGRKTALQGIWTEVKNEYSFMVDGSKDAFCDTGATGTIAEAMQHYRYIVATYDLEDFVVDGSDNAPKIASNNPLTNLVDTTTIIIASITIVSIAAIGGLFFYKKRKEQ